MGEVNIEGNGDDGATSIGGRLSKGFAVPSSRLAVASVAVAVGPKTSSSTFCNDLFGGRPRRLGAGVCVDGPATLAAASSCSVDSASTGSFGERVGLVTLCASLWLDRTQITAGKGGLVQLGLLSKSEVKYDGNPREGTGDNNVLVGQCSPAKQDGHPTL